MVPLPVVDQPYLGAESFSGQRQIRQLTFSKSKNSSYGHVLLHNTVPVESRASIATTCPGYGMTQWVGKQWL